MKKFLEKIGPHALDEIDNLKKCAEWKIHLTMKSKFLSSTDSNEKCMIYSKRDNSMVMIGNDRDKIIQELFDSLLQKYQINLKQSMKDSKFIFHYISGVHYIFNKISISHGGSYINSPKWISSKKVTINQKKE